MYGYDHPDDPIGPEPAADAPDQRAAWHEAFLALGPADGPDVRAMPDGRLWLIRDTYAAETAWAPRHVGKELRLARLGAANADLDAIRAAAEAEAARKAGDHDRAERHEILAACYQAMGDRYRQQETIFAATMEDRREWEHATEHSRHLAVAADAELRRRHPDQQIEPLRSAEPAPVSDTEREDCTSPRTRRSARWRLDPRPGRPAPGVPREARRTPGTHDPQRRPRLGRPRRGLPRLARPGATRSSSRRNRKSGHRRRSSSSPPSTTPNPRPLTDRRTADHAQWRFVIFSYYTSSVLRVHKSALKHGCTDRRHLSRDRHGLVREHPR